ncbi:MAG: CHAT domain-containing protein [Saprospiraceae bacterium]|nr:CHAT domain-containing protein [Saprospiraceae bacterium]
MQKTLFILPLVFWGYFSFGQTYEEAVNSRDSLFNLKNYTGAISYAEQVCKLALERFGDTSNNHIAAQQTLLRLWDITSQIDSLEHGLASLDLLIKKAGKETSEASAYYYFRKGRFLNKKGQTETSKDAFERALLLSDQVLGIDHVLSISIAIDLAPVYHLKGSYQQEKNLLLRVISHEESTNPGSFNQARCIYSLGIIAYETNLLDQANANFFKAKQLFEHLNSKNALFAIQDALFNVAELQGDFVRMLVYVDSMELILKSMSGAQTALNARLSIKRAQTYFQLGESVKCLAAFVEAKTLLESIDATRSPDYFRDCIFNYAAALNYYQKYEDAIVNYQLAAQSSVPVFGPDNNLCLDCKRGEAECLAKLGQVDRAMRILKENQGKYAIEKDGYAQAYFNFLLSCSIVGSLGEDYELSRTMSDDLLEFALKNFGETSKNIQTAKAQKVWVDIERQDWENAAKDIQNDIETTTLFIKNGLFILPEREQISLLGQLAYKVNRQIAIAQKQPNRESPRKIYEHVLFRKGLAFSLSKKAKSKILNSTDSLSIQLFQQWKSDQEELSRIVTLPPNKVQQYFLKMDSLRIESTQLEKAIALRNYYFMVASVNSNITYSKLSALLKPNEVMVDIFRFSQKISKIDQGNRVGYAIFIIKPDSPEPQMLILENGNDLNSFLIEQYQTDLRRGVAPSHDVYAGFWGKIDPYLKGVKTIYLAPDGIFHKINLNTLRRTDGKYLSEVYDIRVLQSMEELLIPPNDSLSHSEKTAVLVGNPRFDFSSPLAITVNPEGVSWRAFLSDSTFSLLPLPASEMEIIEMSKLLKRQGYQTRIWIDTAATEVQIKSITSPRVLHLATHGHFLVSPKREHLLFDRRETVDNPMLRSMLFFAGATNTLREQPLPPAIGDGVFTAYEAANLNLEGTELVVLSACNTGLGKIENGEGVFGMQRAFRYAGAHYIVMSLWEVEDQATREFMTTFYRHWLEDKKTIPDSFRQTQLDLMKTQTPFQWGAFVLMGN